jgi:hypothetical protein
MSLQPDATSGFVGKIFVAWGEGALPWVRNDFGQNTGLVKRFLELTSVNSCRRLQNTGVTIRFAQHDFSILVLG